jgi:GWxTD domain-containing protein
VKRTLSGSVVVTLAMLTLASILSGSIGRGGAWALASGQDQPSRLRNDQYGDLFRRWLYQDVVWIITPEERATFMRLGNDEERQQFIQQFWERRNPNPGDSENKFREEHYRRIAYANQQFAAKEDPGWKTDRGRAYIVFGPPDAMDSGNTAADGSGKPTQIWHYRAARRIGGKDVELTFVDACACGEYRLQTPFPK